jgi:ABC-type transport system involved in multi-copper enzyme maturation permease subunit
VLGIADYFWRLVPGNPILRRVVGNGGKKRRDAVIRSAYLGALVVVVLYQLFTGNSDPSNLAELSKTSIQLFQYMSYLQLGLVALLSPIFTAGAITQEKDSQTYDILLSTPLTNGQIVMGSLLSREFFVIALLVSGIPIFAVTQIFGGVAISSIVYSFLISASTAMITGAMAMAIATFKIGTRRTIFSFYLFIVVYLVGGYLLDRVDYFHLGYFDSSGAYTLTSTSLFTGFNPFLALRVIFQANDYLPPNLADLPGNYQSWPVGWFWTNPASFYICFMLFLSLAMTIPSVLFLRRLAQSTTSLRSWFFQLIRVSKGDRSRKPRPVWHNPIAWREAKTKASAARATVLRYGFIIAGMIGAVVLVVMHSTEEKPPMYIDHSSFDNTKNTLYIDGSNKPEMVVASNVQVRINQNDASQDALYGKYQVTNYTQDGTAAIATIDLAPYPRELSEEQARNWLLGLSIVEFSVILLIISNAAASTVTREKEDGTLDLLLSTPITSRYYIWGKLRGLVAFVLPLIAVPFASCLIFIFHDLTRWLAEHDSSFQWIVFPEAILMMPAMLIIVCAFAAILGMQMSLRCRTTVRAVMSSIGIIVGACAGLGWCGYSVLNSGVPPAMAAAIGALSPFTVLTILINPYQFGGDGFNASAGTNYDPVTSRLVAFIFCILAIAGYAAIIWSMYKSMVKNFDMTIRKQSR